MLEEHKCPNLGNPDVIFCKECAPKQPGDYCGRCFWNDPTRRHVWWCYRVYRLKSDQNAKTNNS